MKRRVGASASASPPAAGAPSDCAAACFLARKMSAGIDAKCEAVVGEARGKGG